ncbi:MAG TPA: oligosaccharide flippase family protein [Candidatus Polarisedimenticolia bacterium]|nr:oligosaccharide flippase family protein [Candidatus Polarisedimenticolia bacterium]
MSSTFRPALLLMGGRALGVAIGFLIPVALVRVFNQTEFGTYKQVFLIYATLYGVAQIGMAESLFYFLPSARQRGGRFAANSLLSLAAAGIAALVLLAAAAPVVARVMNNPALERPIVLMGTYLLFMLAAAVLEIAMISRQKYGLASLSYSVSDLARASLYLLPVLVWPTLEALLWGAIAFAALRLAAAVAFLGREYGRELRPDRSLLKAQAAYAGPFALAVLVHVLQANLHSYAVFYSFDPATFAVYAVGCLQIPLIDLIGSSASHVMMVRMSGARAEGREDLVLAIWQDITRKLALFFFPLVGLLLVNAREIIVFLFTSDYAASAPIFMLWSITILGSAFQVDGVLRVYARTRFIFAMNLVVLGLVIALIGPSIGVFQLTGAVLVSLIAFFTAKALALWRIRRLMGVPFARFLPWGALGATLGVSAAAALAASLVRMEAALSPLPSLVLAGAVHMAVYGGLLVLLGLLAPSEKRALAAALRRRIPATPATAEETRTH